MTPDQRARRKAIIRDLWPTDTPWREVLAKINSDGAAPWKRETVSGVASRLGVHRPAALQRQVKAEKRDPYIDIRAGDASYRRALRAFGTRFDDVTVIDDNQPMRRLSIMATPDPRLGMAAAAAREGRRGRIEPWMM